jgi:hypothetical protein
MFNLSRPLPPELEDFYFQPDDRELVDGCVTALTRDGLNVAILSPHSAALEHYGSLLIARLRKFTPTSKIEVYFPTSSDDLLARFNQTLKSQSLAQAMQGRKNILATQFWVLNNASAVPEHELQLLASLVHNFPGANIRLILFLDTSRKAHPSLAAFGKNITRWEIALPSAPQTAQLIAQAKGQAQQKAVRAFLNRLHSSEEQPLQIALVKKRFTNPFARRKPSMAEKAPRAGGAKWLRAAQWAAAIVALLAACTVFMYWLTPSAFQFLSATTAAETQDAKTASNSAEGKTTDGKKVAKGNLSTGANDNKAAETTKTETAKAPPVTNPADPLDELPNEAAAGQAWAKKLPPDSYVVQHLALPVFQNVVAWQQANPKLLATHIVAIYKPGDKLAQFALVSGPFKSRAAAIEFTQQALTPRLAFATPSSLLAERLSPRDSKSIVKPKEARR